MLFVSIDLKTFPLCLLYMFFRQNLSKQLLKVMGGKTWSLCPWVSSPDWVKIYFVLIPGGAKVPRRGWHMCLLPGEAFKYRVLGHKRNFSQLNTNNENSERAKDQWHPCSKVISHLSASTLFLSSASEISSESIAVTSGKTPHVNL